AGAVEKGRTLGRRGARQCVGEDLLEMAQLARHVQLVRIAPALSAQAQARPCAQPMRTGSLVSYARSAGGRSRSGNLSPPIITSHNHARVKTHCRYAALLEMPRAAAASSRFRPAK